MKKRPIYLATVLFLGMLFVACEKNEKNTLSFDKKSVELFIEETTAVKVSGGVAPYTVKADDETVVDAAISGSEITLKGLKEGTTAVRVTDKEGISDVIAVKVIKDPYEDEKGDAAVRAAWGEEFKKVQGTDAGLYELTKAADKTVTFIWSNEAEEAELDSFVLTFKDSGDLIGVEVEEGEGASARAESLAPVGKLTVTKAGEPTEYDVSSWRLVQAEPAEGEEVNTYWIGFVANDKSGLVVAPLTEETVE